MPRGAHRRRSRRLRLARRHELSTFAERADGRQARRSCSSRSICCISTAGISRACRSSSAKRCSSGCSKARRRRSATASTSPRDGAKFFAAACKLGLEGIVAKRAADPYREETHAQLAQDQMPASGEEFVIVGFTDPGGSRTAFGALLVATRDERGRAAALRRQGRHGLRRAHAQGAARALAAARAPHAARRARRRRAASARGVHWVEPKLVAEIAYTEWTERRPAAASDLSSGCARTSLPPRSSRSARRLRPKPAQPTGEAARTPSAA